MPLMLFSDVHPGGGGTALAKKSHIDVTAWLAECGLRGISHKDLNNVIRSHASSDCWEVVEFTGISFSTNSVLAQY